MDLRSGGSHRFARAGASSGMPENFMTKWTGKDTDARTPTMEKATFIADSFNPRTLANMEVALERACKMLATRGEEHGARREIADKILECAMRGDTTLTGLTMAGSSAAKRLRAHKG